MIETALCISDLPLHHKEDVDQTVYRDAAAEAIMAACDGLPVTMTVDQVATYLSSHPKLFNGIAYLPNIITASMIAEAQKVVKENSEKPKTQEPLA